MKTYQPDARVHRENTQGPEAEQLEQENVILGYDPDYKTNTCSARNGKTTTTEP